MTPKVLAVTGYESGAEYWRVYAPLLAMQRLGYPCMWINVQSPELGREVQAADVVILVRLGWPHDQMVEGARWINLLHEHGKRVIYETDDDLFTPFVAPQMRLLGAEKSEAQIDRERQQWVMALQMCDGVIVTVPRLATVVRQFTDAPVRIVPNAIDWDAWRAVCATGTRPAPGLTIGWAGGKRGETDLAPMAEAWGRIARDYPGVTFVVVGYEAPVLLDAVPRERLVVIPWLPLQQYPRGYHGIDIHCCPLANKPFNRSKTAIKAYEAAAADGAVVYSPTVYGRELRHLVDGLEAETADDWTAALARLINDAALRQRLAARWARRVRTRYSLTSNLHHWGDAWEYMARVPLRRHVAVPA